MSTQRQNPQWAGAGPDAGQMRRTGPALLGNRWIVAGAAGVLWLLLLISYFMTWAEADGQDYHAAVNGFGFRELRGINFTTIGLPVVDNGVLTFVLTVLVLLLGAGGIALTVAAPKAKIGVVVLAVSGGVGVLHALIGLMTDGGIERDHQGIRFDHWHLGMETSKTGAVFLALTAALLLLVLALAAVITVRGAIVPGSTLRNEAGSRLGLFGDRRGITGTTGVLWLLLLVGYLMAWSRTSTPGRDGYADGFGFRELTGFRGVVTDISALPFIVAMLVLTLGLSGLVLTVLVPTATLGPWLLAVAGGAGVLHSIIGGVTGNGLKRDWQGEPLTNYFDEGVIPGAGVFLALVVSALITALAVYLLRTTSGPVVPEPWRLDVLPVRQSVPADDGGQWGSRS